MFVSRSRTGTGLKGYAAVIAHSATSGEGFPGRASGGLACPLANELELQNWRNYRKRQRDAEHRANLLCEFIRTRSSPGVLRATMIHTLSLRRRIADMCLPGFIGGGVCQHGFNRREQRIKAPGA